MRFVPLVLKNVFRKRTRTLLTVASIVLPLLVICFFGTFLRALDRPDAGATRGMWRLVVRHKVSLTTFLPLAYREKVRQMPGVAAATDFSWYGGAYRDRSAVNQFPRFAVEPESFLKVYDDAIVTAGSSAEWLADRTGLLVGQSLVEKYGWKLGQKVVFQGDIFPGTLELTIRAAYRLPDGASGAAFFHRETLEERAPFFKGLVGTIWIKAVDGAAAERLPAQVEAAFENSPWPVKCESEKAFQTSFVSMLGNVTALVNAIAAIIVLVVLLIAANTMAMAARERVTEIAVLRTLGFGRGTILLLVLGESLAIALLGGALGTGLFVLLEPGLKRTLMQGPAGTLASAMQVYPSVLLTAFAISVAVGVAAGIVPALRAARRPIVQGLRQVA